MSRKILMSSDFTKLMATPLRPNRPERPILKEERSCMCIQLWVKVWWKVNLTLWLLRVTSISFLPYHTTHESQTKVKRRGRNPQLKKLLIIRKMQREQNGEFKYWFPDAKVCEELRHLPVNVQFTIVWQVVVDNQRHLLHIYASSPHICWDQYSTAWNKQREDVRVKHFTSWRKNITFERATHISLYLCPDLNSFMIASLSFCGISPCIAETVKFASRIFSTSQSTWKG